MGDLADYVKVVLAARRTLVHTLIDGELLGSEGLEVEGAASFSTFRNSQSGLRSAVLVNPCARPVSVKVMGFTGNSSARDSVRVMLWQPSAGARQIELPVNLRIPGDRLAIAFASGLEPSGVHGEQAALADWTDRKGTLGGIVPES